MTKPGVRKMGSDSSKKKHTNTKEKQATTPETRSLDGVKRILLVHNSPTPEEVKTVKNFRDALIQAAPGNIKIEQLVNMADESSDLKDSSWLESLNNVILIRLTAQNLQSVANILRKNQFIDENNQLHNRIVAVSFGTAIPSGWPPSGTTRPGADQRDFVFGFENEDNLKAKDFQGARLNSLVNAIMATN